MKTYKVVFISTIMGGVKKLYDCYVRAPGPLRAGFAVKARFGHFPRRISRSINMDSISDDTSQGTTQVFNWRKLWATSTKG